MIIYFGWPDYFHAVLTCFRKHCAICVSYDGPLLPIHALSSTSSNLWKSRICSILQNSSFIFSAVKELSWLPFSLAFSKIYCNKKDYWSLWTCHTVSDKKKIKKRRKKKWKHLSCINGKLLKFDITKPCTNSYTQKNEINAVYPLGNWLEL